jgi:hypothetical protein
MSCMRDHENANGYPQTARQVASDPCYEEITFGRDKAYSSRGVCFILEATDSTRQTPTNAHRLRRCSRDIMLDSVGLSIHKHAEKQAVSRTRAYAECC